MNTDTFSFACILEYIFYILKYKQKKRCQYSWDYIINHNENEDEIKNHRYNINRPMSRHGHRYSKYKKVSVWWCLFALSNA